jgi:hypothetical protein
MKLGQPLTDRASQALVLLGRLNYLTTRQLSDFLFCGTSVQPASRPVLVRRVLKSLVAGKLIEPQLRLIGGPGGGSSVNFYRPTPLGRRLANIFDESLDVRPTIEGRVSIRHAIAVSEVVLLFHRSAIEHPGHDLLSWKIEWQIAARLGRTPIIPDVHLVYATRDTEIEAVIEVDLGTERSRYFTTKIARYLDLLQSGTWRNAFETWPLVLTIVPSEARVALLTSATERYLNCRADYPRLAETAEFAFASLPRLKVHSPVERCWHIAGRSGLYGLETGVV